jgi:glycosyltransferase involved in cell wall biosynthesis
MRVLYVLSGSNQMYSGIGRAIFELCRRMAGRVDYEFTITREADRNLALLRAFCEQHGYPLHFANGKPREDSLDRVNEVLPGLLREKRWDVVECLGWACAATNEPILEHLDDRVLAYTPHDQPTWTVPMSAAQAARIEDVHARMLRRSDVVLCDSPWERRALQARAPGLNNCTFLSLGCDFQQFQPGPLRRREQLLFVGDLAEPRKRFDRLIAIFARLIQHRPALRLVVIGNRSDEARGLIPASLRHACTLMGYVSDQVLRRAYRESAGLLLFSDFEAFGIPILEALASGTPVFLTRQDATESLFRSFQGVHFCVPDDVEATANLIELTLARQQDAIAEVIREGPRLRSAFDWDQLAARKCEALAAAWFRRHAWTLSA